eukprot:TRINITY_DN26997_c0_g1_i1.p1 TRINITY_DN26997_c0_g1~~TRINITY_DN26997_c0_g1_i1.p1  ORF type:complete len:265 (+),score=78.27 TRINITY_DN26997_c0_g1_i1:158-952(+)
MATIGSTAHLTADDAGGPHRPTLLEARGKSSTTGLKAIKKRLETSGVLEGSEDAEQRRIDEKEATALVKPPPQTIGAAAIEEENEDNDGPEVTQQKSIIQEALRAERIMKTAEDTEADEKFWKKAKEALVERTRREALLDLLRKHGFRDVNSRTGWFWNYRYPLHVAVELKDAAAVSLLLEFKAKSKCRDANGLTPRQLARKKNHGGSHAEVLRVLSEHAASRKARKAAKAAAKAMAAKSSSAEAASENAEAADAEEDKTGDAI